MARKRILLTGGSGFIGRNILEQLGKNYDFIAPSHEKLDLVNFSKVQKIFQKNKPFDLVIHTAVCGGNRKIPNTSEILSLNLKMFFNIASCDNYWDKMIYLGSGIEFGKEKPIKLISENDFGKRIPEDNFGLYKYICAKYSKESDRILNLRLYGVWGKYEDYSIRFISNAICKSLFNMPITINQNVYFDYIYIDDFTKVLNYFINHLCKFKDYNVGTGKPIDLLTIAKKILTISPNKSNIIVTKPGLGNEYTCDNSRLISEIKKIKFSNFDEDLLILYNWYKKRKANLSKRFLLNDYF